jgi:uncharacterized 2Fe-2S/4Fe-4S cluster protein (DUF4445 family)
MPPAAEGFSPTVAGWVAERAEKACGAPVAIHDPAALRALCRPGVLENEVTLVLHGERGITGVLAGHRPRSLGIAFDVGTTSLAAYLCETATGRVVANASALNPQRSVGEDVISRISACDREPEGLGRLREMVVSGLNDLTMRCLLSAGADAVDVDEVVVAGNPAMEQIVAGVHPHAIGVSPYCPAAFRLPDLRAGDVGLAVGSAVNVHFLPVVSGFVGGDTIAAALADGTEEREETTLLVDIGTNGEILLGGRGGLWAASCATGPAFEGAQIACGMRAASGAIDRVALGPDGRLDFRVLGEPGTKPMGICGSGIIDAVAALRRVGGIEADGRFDPRFPGVFCDESGLGRRIVLVPGCSSGTGKDIVLTLKDVRQLQLAKAALNVGIVFLMERLGVTAVDRTVLTGAFGARFDWRSAVAIGMLPVAVADSRVEMQTNLAGVGAAMALVNRCHRERAVSLQRRVRFIELAGDGRFAERFARATGFPDLERLGFSWN